MKKNVIILALLMVLAFWVTRPSSMPHIRTGQYSWTEPILAFFHFLSDPSAWAGYTGQNVEPHMYYSNAGATGTGLASNSSAPTAANPDGNPGLELTPPTAPDEALACLTTYQGWTDNSATASADNETYLNGIGTQNSEAGGCPLWPYNGSHVVATGVSANGSPLYAPANHFGYIIQQRADAIVYSGQFGCGGNTSITSITTSGTCPGAGCTEVVHVANTSGFATNNAVQVTGSSISADNSAAGATFKITAVVVNTTVSFINSAAAACGASCGTLSWPYQIGAPPYTVPLGADNIHFPNIFAQVTRTASASGTIAWQLLGQMVCGPMIACPYFNGCGLWAVGNSAGGPGYQ